VFGWDHFVPGFFKKNLQNFASLAKKKKEKAKIK
jgi:hypothetical protein